ncbi:hypothetical protein Q6273_27930, partial [Klebsiella pneumoniae]
DILSGGTVAQLARPVGGHKGGLYATSILAAQFRYEIHAVLISEIVIGKDNVWRLPKTVTQGQQGFAMGQDIDRAAPGLEQLFHARKGTL